MSGNTLPRLRDDAVVRPFDERGAPGRYVIAIDGHHFVVTPVVAAVLDESRKLRPGEGDIAVLAARVAQRLGHEIPIQRIRTLLRQHAPKCFFAADDARSTMESPVRLRRLLLGGERLKPALDFLGRLFDARVATILCTAAVLVILCVVLQLWQHGSRAPDAGDLLTGFVLTLCGILVHELGHLAACHRFGGHHGGIGIGVYWCLPAFYAEVHGAWLLPRRQRAAVDAGGIYLQGCFVALLGAACLVRPAPALLSAIVWTLFLMLHTLNPVLKFDGYWLLCDLAGVHNLHDTLRQLVRGVFHGHLPGRMELLLLATFGLLAFAYLAYALGMLGSGLGSTGAALHAAWIAADGSPASLAGLLGRMAALAFLLVAASGLSVLIARAARDLLREPPRHPLLSERKST